MGESGKKGVPEIVKSVEALEAQVRAEIARVRFGTRLLLIIGIVLIAFVFGYLTWLSMAFGQYSDPEELATMVLSKVQPKVDQTIEDLDTNLTNSAEKNVKYVIDDMLSRMPALREKAEDSVAELVDKFADDLDTKVDSIVEEMLEQKKVELDPLIEAAAQEGQAAELEEAFRNSLEEALAPKLDEVLAEYEEDLKRIDRRLNILMQPDEKLTVEQRLEKEVIAAILIYIDDAVEAGLQTPPEPPVAE